MLASTPTQGPFCGEQWLHQIKNVLANPLLWILTIIASYANHFAGAPELWHKLGTLAVTAFVLDFITGTTRSIVLGKKGTTAGPGLDSRSMGAMCVKATVYLAMFVLTAAADWFAGADFVLSGLAVGIIASREVLSNFENLRDIYKAYGWKWPFARIEKAIRELLKR
jgi:hypothetical protein